MILPAVSDRRYGRRMADDPANENDANEPAAPLSLARLKDAFARMLGAPAADNADAADAPPAGDPTAVTPEGIVEALLFVGRPDDAPLSADEIAELIRDVSPEEVDRIVERLDGAYREEGAACRVQRSAGGYRLALAEGLERVGDRLRGRVRATRLSQTALETLAVVAYRQPIAAGQIDELRGQRCATTLRMLTRNGLVARQPATESQSEPRFVTTDRFLRTFDLATVEQLPRVAELDD